jgi:hypothetical protein
MVLEKISATARSAQALARSNKAPDWASVVSPWHKRAKSNSRRLRLHPEMTANYHARRPFQPLT